MAQPRTVTAYIDYKSPYAYLAKDLAYELERDFAVRVDWLPYVLDIPSFLGSARVDDSGRVIEEERNAHQWRRVRYSYMDCRRQARKRALVLRGYNHIIFERFWKRELDIEDPDVIGAVLAESGANTTGFSAYSAGAGRGELDRICRAAEAIGVFGVPSFVVDGELFWGR